MHTSSNHWILSQSSAAADEAVQVDDWMSLVRLRRGLQQSEEVQGSRRRLHGWLLVGYARDEVHTDPYSIDVSSPRINPLFSIL